MLNKINRNKTAHEKHKSKSPTHVHNQKVYKNIQNRKWYYMKKMWFRFCA